MNRHHQTRVQRAERGDGFFRITMYVTHGPARLIRADRQQGDIEWTVSLADRSELRMIARIPPEKHATAVWAGECKAAPERVATVPDPAAAEMLRRRRRNPHPLDAQLLPPIQLDDRARSTAFLDKRGEPKRDDPRRLRMRPCQTSHRRVIEMVVV